MLSSGILLSLIDRNFICLYSKLMLLLDAAFAVLPVGTRKINIALLRLATSEGQTVKCACRETLFFESLVGSKQ